ncbi:MAG: hypothetical protein EOO16_11040 [Chitinophagaceae bacterium]|nr:MAG: hypothetical protein EOO16_11040 [Chitinophagaceae bacterium]
MKKQVLFFGDPFKWVGNLPLGKFGRSAIGRLRADFPEKATRLENLAKPFEQEAGLIVENETIREEKVADADALVTEFTRYVTDVAEGAIRYAAGGKEGALYRDFFPEGKSEISNANKSTMGLLTKRMARMAVRHAALVPVELTTKLQGFEGRWSAAYEAQESGKASVTESREDHSEARRAYVYGLVQTMHEIAAMKPCDVAFGKQYFDFEIVQDRAAPAPDPAPAATA